MVNNKERNKLVSENIKKYHTPNCPRYIKRAKNAVFISPSNSIEHEQMKLKICYDLRKEKIPFITEAVRNKQEEGKERRVDVVNLVTCDEIEVECNHRIKKKGAITIYV